MVYRADQDTDEVDELYAVRLLSSPSFAALVLIDAVNHLDMELHWRASLESKAIGIMKDLEKDKDDDAKDKASAFINAVNAQNGKKLTLVEAEDLILTATVIIDLIEEGLNPNLGDGG